MQLLWWSKIYFCNPEAYVTIGDNLVWQNFLFCEFWGWTLEIVVEFYSMAGEIHLIVTWVLIVFQIYHANINIELD